MTSSDDRLPVNDPDPVRSRVAVDRRSYEEWVEAEYSALPPCPDCGSPYDHEPSDGGEGDNDFGYLEDAVFSCSSEAAYGSDEAFEGTHPISHGWVEVSRYTTLNRWVFEKYGPSPSAEDLGSE